MKHLMLDAQARLVFSLAAKVYPSPGATDDQSHTRSEPLYDDSPMLQNFSFCLSMSCLTIKWISTSFRHSGHVWAPACIGLDEEIAYRLFGKIYLHA